MNVSSGRRSAARLWVQLNGCLLLLVPAVAAGPAQEVSEYQLTDQAIKGAVERMVPYLVRIETIGGVERPDAASAHGVTTGVLFGKEGHILSSSYGFAHDPHSILATLPGGQRVPVRLLARDQSRSLVLLAADVPVSSPDKTLPLAPREQLRVGQTVIAIGRTFSPDRPNLSAGVLSATHRIWGRAVQTDAKISPANYGGLLIDLTGQAIGVLVPLSADMEQTGTAGAELYDAGIGFAVPWHDLLPQLDKLKAGQDLHAGRLGITLKGNNIYADRAIVGVCAPRGPANKAGILPGDEIVAVDGVPVSRQVHMKQLLGPHYGGETVRISVRRGNGAGEGQMQDLEFSVELVDRILPYEHAFIGVLPERAPGPAGQGPAQPAATQLAADTQPAGDTQPAADGVAIRHVFDNSPAARAGLQPGNRITRIDDAPVTSADDLRTRLATYEPGQDVLLHRAAQDGPPVSLKLVSLPDVIPDLRPPPPPPAGVPPGDSADTGRIDVKVTEEGGECTAYVPVGRGDVQTYSILVLLHQPDSYPVDQMITDWKPVCDERHLILLLPKATSTVAWFPVEVTFIRKTLEEMIRRYPIDRQRVAIYGYQGSGKMAYAVAFRERALIRGLVVADALPPAQLGLPANEPFQRLAVVLFRAEQSPLAAGIDAMVKEYRESKYPVTSIPYADAPRPLVKDEREQVARWLDTLDRL